MKNAIASLTIVSCVVLSLTSVARASDPTKAELANQGRFRNDVLRSQSEPALKEGVSKALNKTIANLKALYVTGLEDEGLTPESVEQEAEAYEVQLRSQIPVLKSQSAEITGTDAMRLFSQVFVQTYVQMSEAHLRHDYSAALEYASIANHILHGAYLYAGNNSGSVKNRLVIATGEYLLSFAALTVAGLAAANPHVNLPTLSLLLTQASGAALLAVVINTYRAATNKLEELDVFAFRSLIKNRDEGFTKSDLLQHLWVTLSIGFESAEREHEAAFSNVNFPKALTLDQILVKKKDSPELLLKVAMENLSEASGLPLTSLLSQNSKALKHLVACEYAMGDL